MKPSVSIVVPCYYSSGSLPLLVQRLEEVLAGAAGLPFELILVDDGSLDSTWEVILELAHSRSNLRGFRMIRNFGQHNALLCGIREAKYPIVVTMDDDLQNPPEEVPRLLAKLAEGYDVVYGTPRKQTHGLMRDLASTLTKMTLQSVMGAATARNISAFRAFRTDIRRTFADYRSPLVSIDVLLTWGARRFATVEVRSDPRTTGQSHYTLGRLLRHSMNMMTGFSIAPLQFASLLGFVLTLVGVAVLLWVLGRYLIQGSSVPGFPFLASIVAIFSGAQLFTLGLFGEYLARIHLRTMERPAYTVDASTEATK
jgi:undecaprenyl-phosphate 4-deoxy-4-formamido-L-arabinose transferase